MTLAKVRKQLAAIVTGTPVSSTVRRLGRTFQHVPQSSDLDKPADGRRFYFALDSMVGVGPYTPGGVGNRRVDTLRLVVVYPDDVEDAVIEDAVSGDYDALSARLLDSALWDHDSSTIVDVVAVDALLPAALTTDDAGLTLTITLAVEHFR